ncbi:MAG: MoxR family ATPase [Candidatus Aenigmatarchaeota archaeon]
MFKGNYKEVKNLVRIALKAKISVLVLGHPGVGKSTMAKELAEEFGLPLVEKRLSQVDPTELVGIQVPRGGKVVTEVPDWVPVERPAFLFLDEINAGVTKLHQAAAYQILLDRAAGNAKFHPDTVIMAAGNLEEDNAIVVPLSSALNNRVAHFVLEPDVDTWLEWAAQNGISPEMRGYISFRGVKGLYNNTGTPAFPSPRSIAMADRLYQEAKANKLKNNQIKGLIQSVIGEGDAIQFMAFVETYGKIDFKEVLLTGNIQSQERSFIYALIFGLSTYLIEKVQPKEVKKYKEGLLRLLKNISHEYMVLFLRELNQRKALLNEVINIITSDADMRNTIDKIISDVLAFEQ